MCIQNSLFDQYSFDRIECVSKRLYMLFVNENPTSNFLRGISSVTNLYPQVDLPERLAFVDNEFNSDFEVLTDDWKKV
jgi:hypothetical protein